MRLNDQFRAWCESEGIDLMPYQLDAAEDIIRLASVREMVPIASGMTYTFAAVERFLRRSNRNPYLTRKLPSINPHVCGMSGFNPMIDPLCPGCQELRKVKV